MQWIQLTKTTQNDQFDMTYDVKLKTNLIEAKFGERDKKTHKNQTRFVLLMRMEEKTEKEMSKQKREEAVKMYTQQERE